MHRDIPKTKRLGLYLAVGLLACLLALQLFMQLARAVARDSVVLHLDHRVSAELIARAEPSGVAVFKLVSVLGAPAFLTALGVTVALVLLLARRTVWVVGWSVGMLGIWLLSLYLKAIFQRRRPTLYFVTGQSWSCPSAHALGSIVAYTLLAYMLFRLTADRRKEALVALAATVAVLAVGFSRIYLGAHYLSDVVGGFLVGGVWAAVCIGAMELVRQHREARVRPRHREELPAVSGTEEDTVAT
jgi:undecaprenyl-diphosphatase